MNITGTRFGTIEYTEEDLIAFADGLIGFPAMTDFLLLHHKPESPFRWLQSLQEPAVAFLVTQPQGFVPEYLPEISDEDAARLKIDAEKPALLLTTAAIPKGEPKDMTLNLAAPIVINADARIGRQVVLDDNLYTVRHRVFPQADRVNESVAA